MREPLLSVIIPVHNGEKSIGRTAKQILAQSWKNLELILVENFSTDHSTVVCEALESEDSRVHLYHSYERGTSLARRLGVEKATGEYIVFSDQDDSYVNRESLKQMIAAIEEDMVQIVQFSHYERRGVFFKKRFVSPNNRVLLRKEMIDQEIGGILGGKGSLNTPVWNKIYCANVLKDAVKNIDVSLYYAEDEYLNAWAFLNKRTQKISIRSEAYYVWNAGIGFSSRRSSEDALCKDYELIKDVLVGLFRENGVSEKVIWDYHLESIYFARAIIMNLIYEHAKYEVVLDKIRTLDQLGFVQDAKRYVSVAQSGMWEELLFLSTSYTADEYYLHCKRCLRSENCKRKLKRLVKRVISC